MVTKVLKQVFGKVQYMLVAVVVAFIVVSAALLLPNKVGLKHVLFSDFVDIGTKFSFVGSLYASIATNFTLVTASYLILVAVLFGVNTSLLVFYIKKRQVPLGNIKAYFASIGGMVSAVFGIGCAACGSVVLTAVFGLLGAGSIISFLPLHGLEFGLVGVTLLSFSIWYLIKKINDPLVCPVV